MDGSGGNGHALEHFHLVHHPIAVKITSLSSNVQEVYCYQCDDEQNIEMPLLEKLLDQFGAAGLL